MAIGDLASTVVEEAAELLPQVAADLVESVADELHDMEDVGAHDRLRGMALGGRRT